MERSKDQEIFLKNRKDYFINEDIGYDNFFKKIESLKKDSLIVPMYEENIKEILERGILKENSNKYKRGEVSRCHSNSAYFASKFKKYRLMTGYAYTEEDGLWRQHSWLLDNKDNVVETTPIKRDLYFGFILTEEESKRFCEDN